MTHETTGRITHDARVMGGRPCIRGMRVTVGAIVGLLESGKMQDEVLAAYPYIEREDIQAALAFAAWHRRAGHAHSGGSSSGS